MSHTHSLIRLPRDARGLAKWRMERGPTPPPVGIFHRGSGDKPVRNLHTFRTCARSQAQLRDLIVWATLEQRARKPIDPSTGPRAHSVSCGLFKQSPIRGNNLFWLCTPPDLWPAPCAKFGKLFSAQENFLPS